MSDMKPSDMTNIELTYEGLRLSLLAQEFKRRLQETRTQLARQERIVADAERNLALIKAELQKQGFHDVGHARSQYECKLVDSNGERVDKGGKLVHLTPEELDGEVFSRRSYAQREDILG